MLNLRSTVVALAGLAFLAGAGGLVASAAFDQEAAEGAASFHDEAFPPPVAGAELFPVADGGDRDCLSSAHVITRLKAEMDTVGGRIFVLTDGLEQSFADRWRHEARVSIVPVSAVVAHAFPSTEADIVVDVVEFDSAGCAMSRTMISGDDWELLLRNAMGVEV